MPPLFVINPVQAAPTPPYETLPSPPRTAPPELACAPPPIDGQPVEAPLRPPEAVESPSATELPRTSRRPILNAGPPPTGAELRTQIAAERQTAANAERRRIAEVMEARGWGKNRLLA